MPWAAGEPAGVLAGFALGIGLYEVFTFFALRQRARLWLVWVAAATAAFGLDRSESALFTWVALGATVAFANVFLDLPEYDVAFERALLVAALCAVAYPLGLRFAPAAEALQIFGWSVIVLAQLLVAVAGGRAVQRAYPGARFFVVGAIGACAIAFSRDVFGAAMAWQILWFAVALADRLHQELSDDDIPTHVSRAQLQILAELDPLTGIPNRRAFDEHLEAAWERALQSREAIALIMIDVDHFKDYNDHLGHVEGDMCLARIAKACAGSLKRSGDFFARYGGEEFAAIITTRNDEDVVLVAERMRAAVLHEAMPHPTNSGGLVTISLGTARMHPSASTAFIDLVTAADEALYDAKSRGRNCIRTTFAQA